MKEILTMVRELAQKYYPDMVALRRYFHANPEIAFTEIKTSQKIRKTLSQLKIKSKQCAQTGLLGRLNPKPTGPVCAIRSDMDALPILEQTKLSFKSKTPGIMHACGHDVHMATVLGAAMILAGLKDRLKGEVRFIFQPAEEVPPGGAVEMIKAGVMAKPPVKMIFGLHTDPHIPVGKIGLRDGVMMSAVLDFDLTVTGKGGHGARPHDCSDAIVIASQLINSLQTIVSRSVDPVKPAVITLGQIEGGTARNIIANEVRIKGTIRATEMRTVALLKKRVRKICENICKAFDGQYKLDYVAEYPPLYNRPEANQLISETTAELYGKKSVTILENPALGGEDFAHYLQYAPGAMFRLGVRNAKIDAVHGWHSDKYMVDENAMLYGSAILAGAVLRFFNQKG